MTQFRQPENPGSVIDFIGARQVRTAPSAEDTVAIVGTATWGAVAGSAGASIARVTSVPDLDAALGTLNCPLRRGALQALNGSGLPGDVGAGAVLLVRAAGAAKAQAALSGANVTALGGLSFTARYAGTRGNNLSIVHEAIPGAAGKFRIKVLEGTIVRESYQWAGNDGASVVAGVAARKDPTTGLQTSLVIAAQATQTASTPGAYSLVGGNDGTTLINQNLLDALQAMEYLPFSIFAFAGPPVYGLNAGLAAVKSWMATQDAGQRPVRLVAATEDDDTLTDAIGVAAGLNDPHITLVSQGTFTDALLDQDVTILDAAPRFAGQLASAGRKGSLTFQEQGGLTLKGQLLAADQLQGAALGGVTVLRRCSSPDADVLINQAVTTFTVPDADHPVAIFGDPRLVGIMDRFRRETAEWGDRTLIGKTVVGDDSRAAAQQHLQMKLDELIGLGLVMRVSDPMPFVQVLADPELPRAIPFTFGWQFNPTTLYFIGQGRVR